VACVLLLYFRVLISVLFVHYHHFQAVSQDRVVRLSQFGSFERCQSDARMGRNPHNGEAIQIPAKKRVRFKPYDAYKKSVNGGP
jgi:DNA-binding protein HU-beta